MPKKLILFDGTNLYQKTNGNEPSLLGTINTRKGQLTKTQKLKAVQFINEWVEV